MKRLSTILTLALSGGCLACSNAVESPEPNPLAATSVDYDAPIYGSDQAPITHEEAVHLGTLGTGDLTVLMVVDRSSSMAGDWDGMSKWQLAVDSLSRAIDGVEEELTVGALLFPQRADCEVAPLEDAAQIQFQRGDLFRNEWQSSLGYPSGGTPMGEAFRQTDAAIAIAEAQGLLERRFRVVLVTDGEPSCDENPEHLIAMADSWRDRGIQVRVMGLPGSVEAANLLNAIAGQEVDPLVASGDEPPPPTETTWTEDPDDNDQGYIAPENQDEVDDSFHVVVR